MRTTALFSIVLLSIMAAGSAMSEVNVVLPDTTAFSGDTIRVPIRVSDVTGLEIYSYQCKIRFDSTVVKALAADSAGTLTQGWGKTWVNLNVAGEMLLGNYSISPLEKAGVLVYLRLLIVGPPEKTTQLKFEEFEFNSGAPKDVTTDGSLAVIYPPVIVHFRTNVETAVQITVDGRIKNTPYDTSWAYGSSHTIGSISPQPKTADDRYVFQSWSDGGGLTHTVTVKSDTTFTLTMSEEFLLTLQSAHGTVRGNGWYAKGTAATFSVDSLVHQGDSLRFVFQKWQGIGGSSYSGPQCKRTIIMNGPVTETAEWGQQYFLTLQSPYGKPQGQGWYDQGITVTIDIDSLITVVDGTRRMFVSWIGQGQGSYSGSRRMAAVTMLAPIREQATWQTQHYLWLKTVPAGIADFKNSGWYSRGDTAVTDTARTSIATEEYSYKFKSWSLAGAVMPGNPIRVVMDTSHIAKAVYKIDSVAVSLMTDVAEQISIDVDGLRYFTPYKRFWCYRSEHTIGIDSLQFSADSTVRFGFRSWSDLGKRVHQVKADSSLKITAHLEKQFRLALKTYPAGLINFSAAGYYHPGDTVRLPQLPERLIVASDTLRFKGWLLNRRYLPGNRVSVVMNHAQEAVALYRDALSISGQVVDRQGHVIPQCQLLLSGDCRDTLQLATESQYAFQHLLPGNYRITPMKDGCQFLPVFRQFPVLQESKRDQKFTAIDRAAPAINLLHPNGGEQLQAGREDSIVWQASDNVGIDSLWIELSSNNGASWRRLLRLQPQSRHSITWMVPETASEHCLLRVLVQDYDGNQAEDVSDGIFAIIPATGCAEGSTTARPNEFEVFPNYPNPFNSMTAIRFQIPTASLVTVKVLNAMGQEVVTLVNDKLQAGQHQINWNGRDLQGMVVSSGIYFLLVEMGNREVTRKLLYLR